MNLKKELGDKMKKLFEDTMTKCEEKIENSISKIKDTRSERPLDNDTLINELESVKNKIISKGIEEVKKQKGKDDSQLQDMQQKIEEIEKEKRLKNLIFFNLKESNQAEPVSRYKEDETNCKEIIVKELGLDHMEGIGMENLIRLGKKNDRNRPLLVKLRSEEEVRMILRVASKLRHSEKFERVYISRDLTLEERTKEKGLREELREKRKGDNGTFIIRKGRIVQINGGDQIQQDGQQQRRMSRAT